MGHVAKGGSSVHTYIDQACVRGRLSTQGGGIYVPCIETKLSIKMAAAVQKYVAQDGSSSK
jgi:hypothetical protein